MEPAVDVMVVEDDATVLAVVTDYLRGRGYRVTGLGRRRRGLRSAAHRPARRLILDRMLPGVSGDALCRQVRVPEGP